MSKKEIMALSEMRLSFLPSMGKRIITMCLTPSSDSEVTEAAEIVEAPLLFSKENTSLAKHNKQTIGIMEEVVLETHKMVCIDIVCEEKLRFTLEYFFYMNDVKTAFPNPAHRWYEIFNGAPKKKRNCDRGVLQKLYPITGKQANKGLW